MDMNAAAIFACVVDAKGFTAAARLLDIPKTTVSKRISDLEAELGTRLLNRTTRALSLTEAGARAYPHIVDALRNMEVAEREARAIAEQPSGLLTIAAPGALGVPFVVPLIIDFMDRYPAIEVAHMSVDSPVDLGEERIDIMIWPGDHRHATHAVPVAQVDITLYASAEYLEQYGAPRTPQDLAQHPVVALAQAMHGKRFAWVLKRGTVSVEIVPSAPIRFRSNDPGAILAAVAAGQGIGGLPTRFVDRMAAGAGLLPVLPGWKVPPTSLSALYRDGSAASLKARLFIDFVVDWFRSN